MTTKNARVIFKKSGVSGKVPEAAILQHGEIAMNYVDGELYYKDTESVVKAIHQKPLENILKDLSENSPIMPTES